MTAVVPPPDYLLEVVDDLPGEFAERIVEAFHYRATERFRIVLTGGEVAHRCYERLAEHAETQIDWWLVEVWTGHPELARETLLNRVGAAYAVHGPLTEADAGVPLDVVHVDLCADGSAFEWPPTETAPALVIVTACGADGATALLGLQTIGDAPFGRLTKGGVVLLADRTAAAALSVPS